MTFWPLILLLLTSCGKPITSKRPAEKNFLHQGVAEGVLLETTVYRNFHLLPLLGKVDAGKKFWSGDAWGLKNQSINSRWNDSDQKYLSPSAREVTSMPLSALAKLAPSEKFDLYVGRYDYPLKNEVSSLIHQDPEDWEGLCHGWAAATSLYQEPEPRIVMNPDGIQIPFGSADIKALLSYAYSKILLSNEQILGNRCEKTEDCDDDLSAISFHLLTANKIGLRGQSYIVDVDPYREVWNHPVIEFESKIEGMKSSRTGRTVSLTTKIVYVELSKTNSWDPTPRITGQMTLKYELDLDQNGNVVDGRWNSKKRPDFIWGIKDQIRFRDSLEGLETLLK